jgi:propionyl-CoA carboxylase alpha chain
MFKKILIANRARSPCRVMQDGARMGIATVAVYSEADRDALHVRFGRRGGTASARRRRSDSYLVDRQDHRRAPQTGAEAVHPGYGFLSERGVRARPGGKRHRLHRPQALLHRRDGRQDRPVEEADGRRRQYDARHNARPSPTRSMRAEIAKGIGYPVMIKASAGGGGKGMRVARQRAEAAEGFDSSARKRGQGRLWRRHASSSRRFVEARATSRSNSWPTAHGNTVYLHERECSLQRRHQKVIEEAPSSVHRCRRCARRMGEQAVAAGQGGEVRQSAGTVEFVVGSDKNFYFLEMNTRLQVEHPVTELITGLDLVQEQMIRVAAASGCALRQEDVRHQRLGHRMPHQCRRPLPRLPAVDRAHHEIGSAAHRAGRARRYRRVSKAARSRCTTTR